MVLVFLAWEISESTPLIRPRSQVLLSCFFLRLFCQKAVFGADSSSQHQISFADCFLLSWKITLWVES